VARGGEVLAVWTRDMAGDIKQHRTRIYSSRFDPVRGWTTPQPVDGAALLDSAPSAAWVGDVPVVAFVRSTNGIFADTDARRVAYRFLQRVRRCRCRRRCQAARRGRASSARPTAASRSRIHCRRHARVRGNRQRVALAYGNACASGTCTVLAQAVTDANGRPIYGERPTALLDGDGNVTVAMRGTGFGTGTAGVQRRPDDPIGMVAHTGELVSFNTARGQGVVTVRPLSDDGAAHYAPAAAYDPELGSVVAISTRSASCRSRSARSCWPPACSRHRRAQAAVEVEPTCSCTARSRASTSRSRRSRPTTTQLTAGASFR
jgi:hypothetical protein